MQKIKNKLWVLLALGFTLSQKPAFATESAYGGFIFSTQFSTENIQLLKDDIDFAYLLPEMRDSNNFKKLSEIKTIDGPNIHNWLLNRIRYFVPEQVDFEILFGLTGQSYKYRTSNVLSALDRNGTRRTEKTTVLATNLGGAFYLYGRQNKTLGTATINGKTKPILSPRIGVVQLGDAYFEKENIPNLDPKATINRFYRLSTLFHEARHSDGNGPSTGFLHVNCPKGHAYEGERACDKLENGAYGLEARFDRMLSKNCHQCSVADIEILRVMALDNFSRLILPTSSQDKAQRLRHALSTYSYILSLCETVKDDESCSRNKIKENTQKYAEIRNQLEQLIRNGEGVSFTRAMGDSRPEGFFEELNLMQTRKLMTK